MLLAITFLTRPAARDLPIIVTCRDVGGQDGWGPLRKELLTLGITGGATHVDIEVEAPAAWKEEMIALARQNGAAARPQCALPLSVHLRALLSRVQPLATSHTHGNPTRTSGKSCVSLWQM